MSSTPLITIQRDPSKQIDVHTPLSYARTVDDYAKVTHEQSLYPGQSFEALARFLHSPWHQRSSGQGNAASKQSTIPARDLRTQQPTLNAHDISVAAFATHYPLVAGQRADGKHLCNPEELESIAQSCSQEKMGQLLLLRGYPSPSWLSSIGALYDIDPEFFRRHLGCLTTSGGDSDQDGVSRLPSSSANVFHFRLPTAGSYTGPMHARGSQTIDGLRNMVQASMNQYRHKLRIGAGWKTGDSIVRHYSIYDVDQFCIEQAVTIQFSRLRHSLEHWIGKLVIRSITLL